MPNFAIRRFQCRHIFTDGHRCGSPCLKGPNGPEDFCYYHHTTRRPQPVRHDPYNEPPNQTSFTLPIPEDHSAIQHGIGEIMNGLARNSLDPRRAGLLLYALQIASLNLKQHLSRPETQETADPVEEITLDPVLGPLAPATEVDETRSVRTLDRLIDEMERESAEAKRSGTSISLEAAASPQTRPAHRTRPCRYPANSRVGRTLR